jgi:hypothetical protein
MKSAKEIQEQLTTETQRHRKKKNLTQRRGDAEKKQDVLFSAPLRLCVRLNKTCVSMLWDESKTHGRPW